MTLTTQKDCVETTTTFTLTILFRKTGTQLTLTILNRSCSQPVTCKLSHYWRYCSYSSDSCCIGISRGKRHIYAPVQLERQLTLAASPLHPSRLIALHAVVIIHMLHAETLQADARVTPCSPPLRSSVTHGIGSVTDTSALYISNDELYLAEK